jgi:signal transduction histidine kinase
MNEKTINILILEDDEDDAFYILDLIQGGISDPKPVVDHISDFSKIREKLSQKSYDICFLDYRLGEIDGIDLLRALRAENVSIPIILLTGQGDQEVAVEAMKAGATDYISKNKLSSEQLVNSIRYAIGLHKEAQRRKDTEQMLKSSHEELKTAHQNLQKSMDQLKTAQFQLLRSEKLAGIGRLAAGVCHEILNPLNIISGHVQALNMERNEDDVLIEDLDSITEEIHRIEKIISGLLKFSRKGEMELSFIDIHSELESVLSILEKDMVLEGIGVVRLFHPETPKLWADADRLRQVFLNLINNARFAMTNKGGKLTVFTELVSASDYTTDSHAPAIETSNVLRIGFIDNGTGIKKANLHKIFDPFFTTKPEDKGTGLGLSICYSIIEKHGGHIEAISKTGKGSTFTIDLPVHKDPFSTSSEQSEETALIMEGSKG